MLDANFGDGVEWRRSLMISTHLHFRIGPARYFDNHVQDGLALVGIERDIVEWRDRLAILLGEDAVLKSIGRADPTSGVCVCGVGVVALLGDGKRSHCG